MQRKVEAEQLGRLEEEVLQVLRAQVVVAGQQELEGESQKMGLLG